MKTLSFSKGIPCSNTDFESIGGLLNHYIDTRGTTLLIGLDKGNRYWILELICSESVVLPSVISTVSHPIRPLGQIGNMNYYCYNRAFTGILNEVHKGFSQIVKKIEDIPFERFFSEDFTLCVQLVHTGEAVGSLYQTAQICIGTTSKVVAERMARVLGCKIVTTPSMIEVTTNELQFIFRPPIASDVFSPMWANRPNDFLEYLQKKPSILNRHLLICGKPGSGKSTTLRRIVSSVIDEYETILVFDKKGEYKDFARQHGCEYIEAVQKESLKTLHFNPFVPASKVRLSTHIEELATNLTVTLFGGAGSLASGFTRLFLEQYYEALLIGYKTSLGFNENEAKLAPFVLNLTGNDLITKLGKGYFYIFEKANNGFTKFWDLQKEHFFDKVFGGVSNSRHEVMAMLSTRMVTLKNSIFNNFEFGSEGRSIETLKKRKIIISLQGLSLGEVRLLVSLISTQLFTMVMTEEESNLPNYLLVLEEAQNIAAKTSAGSGEVISGEKVLGDQVTRALAETRSKGMGVICVTQSPSQLVDGVIANTGLKVVHNLVGRDQEAIGHALGMMENQDFTTLDVGTCWVKIDGNVPFLYQVPA
jgi:energy-coupling factor transporter ATP-binding protein EcfA2